MDDDLTFGASVWGTSDPVHVLPPPATTSLHIPDDPSFDDTQFSDEFDSFTTPAESLSVIGGDDDFGDFGEAPVAGNDDFDNADFEEPIAGSSHYTPLRLDPLPSRTVLQAQINEIFGPQWAGDTSDTLTNDGIREMEGISQVLVTPESRDIYKMLLQPPPIRPSNWTRSRIRHQHLISLGIPVNLDEVLPHGNGRPLPPLQISSRPMSTPPPARSTAHRSATVSPASRSRIGTPQPVPAHFGPKPELDQEKIELLLSLDTETLNLLPLATLEQRLNDLRTQTALTSALLTHLLQTREGLQQGAEMYNRLIAELIIPRDGEKTFPRRKHWASAGMNIAHPIPSVVTSISFSFLTSKDIRRISVKQIVNPALLDDLNRPNIGGLYDPALGPSDPKDICATCRLNYFTCPGHFGHIELPVPVFHPLFMVHMYELLRGTCLFCHRFKMSRVVLCKYVAKLRLLERGLLEAAQGVDELRLVTQRRSKVAKNRGGNSDDEDALNEREDVETEETEVPGETEDDFMRRINLYVAVHLTRAPSSKRDDYKDVLVYQARKSIFNEFLKATMLKKCQNRDCGS
ncbi:hypothetical protein AX15_002332 [Amanita polypyramis BW_CC]|nr:hypothetical protein AX15_002332 [Amanita polypyramis BW_CC]